jgi:hypothetical protein
MSRVTTLPDPMTQPSPTVTPMWTIARAAIHARARTTIGAAMSGKSQEA